MKPSVTVSGLLIGMCLAIGCAKPSSPAERPARPVKAQTVSSAPAQADVRYSATIEPFEQVPLSFKASGYVVEILRRRGEDGRPRAAQAGDRIARGAVLARVRDADAREHVNQATARLADARAGMNKARLDLQRAEALFAADSLTKPDLDGARAAFESAEARTASAQADAELARISLQDYALVAPADGVLLDRRVEVGTLVSPGAVGFVLADVRSVKAKFGIPDGMIHSVRLGEAIGVAVESADAGAFSGRITAIAPTADVQSRVFDVEVTLPNPDGRLRPGMIGTVAVHRDDTPAPSGPTLSVPLTAIVRSSEAPGGYAVLVVERRGSDQVAHLRQVELGEVTGNRIAVVKGVNAGESVIVAGATMVVDGELVNPVR